ncbi:MAG: hypothetical protein L6R42_003604 [Xanthoria sp. 1 TBL-2021]|nr:MAG: hypothetical protein L6R42_003604 [Xanthoria sp. 1 TBL-2021]
MHGMIFTFGIRNYFNFTFSLQLGSPPLFPIEKEQPHQRASVAHVTPTEPVPITEHPHSPVPDPAAVTVCQQQHGTSTQPLFPSLQSILDAQLHTHRTAIHHGDGNPVASVVDAAPVLSSSSAAKHPKLTIGTLASMPRTPQSAIRTTPHHLHRPRRQANTFFNLKNTTRHSKLLLPPRLKMPGKDSSSKLLPSPPSSDTPGTPCSRPLSFQTLPPEIRHMIYHELLVSAAPIRKPHKLVCNKRIIMLDKTQPVKDIDSSILRVCRMIYTEALPVLYGRNTFEFHKPRKLRDFSHAGLDRSHTVFAFRDAPAGRFTLIRSIILRLGHDRKPYVWQRPGGQSPPDRKRIWSHWYQYFFNDSDSQSTFDWSMFPSSTNGFPALDKVILDFTDWQLAEGDAIRVEPLVKKLGRSGKLSAVAIKGVKNAVNLKEFRTGLLKPGGVFMVRD